MPGHGPLWQINGLWDGADPNDEEAWGWVAEISTAFDDQDGDLAKLFVRAVTAYEPLVAALEAIGPYLTDCHCGPGSPATCGKCQALRGRRAALLLARGEVAR